MFFNNASFIIQWLILFGIKSSFGGYNFSGVMMIWALMSMIYGISHLFFENVYYLPRVIESGSLDYYLTKPRDVLWSVSIARMQTPAFGDLIYGLVLFFVFGKIDRFPLFLLFSLAGAISTTAFAVIFGSLAFWIKGSGTIANHAAYLLTFTMTYPETIFGGFIKFLIFSVLPTIFLCHIPISIIFKFNFTKFLLIFVFDFVVCFVSKFIFELGLKKYSS
jgi:ABC-2 type transport system permease protein